MLKTNKLEGYVVGIDTDDFTRSRLFACIYCGDTTQRTRDHVVSVSWSGYKRNYKRGDTVPACKECNYMLSDIPLHSISSRASYISKKLEYKYRKILKRDLWTDEELQDMSYKFKFMIKAANDLKNFILSRITHAVLTSLENNDELNIKQQKTSDVEIYRILNRCYYGESYSDIEKSLGFEENKVKKLITNKENVSIVIAFKYEKAIPFDYSLLNLFNKIRKSRMIKCKVK